MNSTTEYKLWEVQHRISRKSDLRTAERAVDPLVWYISTGRVPASVELAFNRATSRQLSTIANRLAKAEEAGKTIEESVSSIRPYLFKMAGISD